MATQDWSRTVFRLRNLPNHVSDPAKVVSLVATALNVPVNHVTIYSLAKTSDIWEVPPSRVATLQLKTTPGCLQQALNNDEWTVPVPDGGPGEALLLDVHFKGMTALNDVDPTSHCADCIAISGLGSHPFGSWQPRGRDKTFMWIRDSIPRSVPGVRSIIYGYDSKLTESSSFQSISDIARTLILQLKSGGWNSPSSKPVVFLAHSLGGLVLKDAIVQMADREKSITGILDSFLGAIMFGVPSLGMEQSHLLAMVTGQPNELLVQDLSRDCGANYVRKLHSAFGGLSFLWAARILWAYETKESPTVVRCQDGSWARTGKSAVLVNPESATCRNYREDRSLTIPINEDHSNMVKFSRGDPNLGVILHSIAEFCSPRSLRRRGADPSIDIPSGLRVHAITAEGVTDSTEEDILLSLPGSEGLRKVMRLIPSLNDLHDKLYIPELGFREAQIDTPFQDTLTWIFDLPIFSNWLQEGRELFWIHGKPGSGKSTLMKYITRSKETWELLHNWRSGTMEVKASFFFHHRGSAVQKSLEGVLRSLVTQILAPYRAGYWSQHGLTWERFQTLQKDQRELKKKRYVVTELLQEVENRLEEGPIELVRSQSRFEVALSTDPSNAPVLAAERSSTLWTKDELQEHKYQGSDLEELQQNLATEKEALQNQLGDLDASLGAVKQALVSMTKSFQDKNEAMTEFLTRVVDESHLDSDGLITMLEKVLRRLLDQDAARMDLILFFDALDEFDGHLDVISRFLKCLVEISPTSSTRVKVCFSSRPWEPLKAHFSSYPSISLQDWTKQDIEHYTMRSVTRLPIPDDSLSRLIPSILSRANGVFLWVKLALSVLAKAAQNPETSADTMEQKLQELPDDLSKFYELIVKRIRHPNRRRAFVLLELLTRHNELGSPVTATQIRDAVLISGCTSYQEARHELIKAHAADTYEPLNQQNPNSNEMGVRDDISTWGGGLVEITRQDNVDRPQLMHQTVLEFTMGLSFKQIVLGDLSRIQNENGHSFHLKYWGAALKKWTQLKRSDIFIAMRPRPESAPFQTDLKYPNMTSEDVEKLQHFAYHAGHSERTTGNSLFSYLYSITHSLYDALSHDADFVFLAASYGLNLCLEEWVRSSKRVSPVREVLASLDKERLLEVLAFAPPCGSFNETYLTTIRLLVKHGYRAGERDFYGRLWVETWMNKQEEYSQLVTDEHLFQLLSIALDAGTAPNIRVSGSYESFNCTTGILHIATPSLVDSLNLIGRGADPNEKDSEGWTPLDWMISFPPHVTKPSFGWDLAPRYEMCNRLVRAGGRPGFPTSTATWKRAMAEFEQGGYNTSFLRLQFERRWPLYNQLLGQQPGDTPIPAERDKKQKSAGSLSKIFRLRRDKGTD